MKKKCISTATLSVLLLVLFLPVFYYIVFYGTNVNYNEMHKIITVEGNKVLSLCAVIGVAVLGAAYYFLRKIPYTGRIAVWFTGITLAVCILFCLVKAINKLMSIGKKKEEPAAPTTKLCPYCKSEIPIDATRCAHCTSILEEKHD